ncbi:flavin-containing monooxygenase [Haladaptatus sp. DFWS20]|uniref:flavin-containing monooxygenase n=1 Tax=Haladaptatus sp. DFWS20 TaxID=3403467 RepID=UPI003EC02779
MSTSNQSTDTALIEETDYDAIIVGAGFSGVYMAHKLRDEHGLSVTVLEKADDVGGTWYHNSYPGARCDSDSWLYCYSFSEEIRKEWEWSERYPHQPEIREYIRFSAEKLDLLKDIEFNTEVTSAVFDDETGIWKIGMADGSQLSTQFFVPAVGNLSKSYIPDFDGIERFEGDWYHTSNWPNEGVNLSDKGIGLIGTGSTGIQIMPKLAERGDHLKVFQRTPNYAVPARNRQLEDDEWEMIRRNYDELWEDAHNSDGGLGWEFYYETADGLSEEEINEALEERWNEGGPLLKVFADALINEDTNEAVCDFIRSKIREQVDDPEVAETLCPKDHPYAAKRPPLAYNGYYEKYNRDDVELIDVNESPIEKITPSGIQTADSHHDLDFIVYATGFDAVTGKLESLNIRGRNGLKIEEKWNAGPRTYLGIATSDFPNMFMITGPQSPSVLTNMTVSIEQHVEWISDCVEYMLENGYQIIEAAEDAEDEWVAHNDEVASQMLYDKADSWYRGENIPGKESTFLIYPGGLNAYREKCTEVAEQDYEGFKLANSLESQLAD